MDGVQRLLDAVGSLEGELRDVVGDVVLFFPHALEHVFQPVRKALYRGKAQHARGALDGVQLPEQLRKCLMALLLFERDNACLDGLQMLTCFRDESVNECGF